MMTDIFRKCAYCKDVVDLLHNSFVYYKKRYYHFDCAVIWQLGKRNNKMSKEECVDYFSDIQKQYKKETDFIINKEKLYKWLQFNYNIVVIPKQFFMKMDSIYEGAYKGLSKGIPPEDILDMWQRKKKELDKIAYENSRKGKEIVGVDRLNYDLAILLSKYDSYLKWKEKQRVLEEERLVQQKEIKEQININKIINQSIYKQNIDNEKNFDLANILDEI